MPSRARASLWNLFCLALSAPWALAHRMCTACIPLKDLLSEAYGFQVSASGLSSAVAFHNGSMASTGAINASQEYTDLMQPILDQAIDRGLRNSVLKCSKHVQQHKASDSRPHFLNFLTAVVKWPWADQQTPTLQRLHPTTALIQSLILMLSPFAAMSPEQLSETAVSIQIPSWLMDTKEVCHVIEAAERTFGRLLNVEAPPSSAYTAAGYELCRISHDAFECKGPGNIMTLEYDGTVAMASMMQTPLLYWDSNPVTLSARAGLTSKGMTEWINEFINSQSPDKLMLLGSHVGDKLFMDAIANSKAIVDSNDLAPDRILVFATAQAAKERLESHSDECGEWEECDELRRQADAIAGRYKAVKPSTRPSTRFPNSELQQNDIRHILLLLNKGLDFTDINV